MRELPRLASGLVALFLGVLSAMAAAPADGPAKGQPLPPFAEVQLAVLRYFEARPNYRPGDLITREDVRPLLAELQKKGLPLPDAKQILEKVPAKGEFLVDQLSTPNGRRFMRRIAVYPDGYDRVDRLSRLPQGQQTVRALIAGPDGDKMIQYMTTAKGGRELGQMLSEDPGGANFNASTGRIYTVPLLLARLQQSHAAALKAAARNRCVNALRSWGWTFHAPYGLWLAGPPDRLDDDGLHRRTLELRRVVDLGIADLVDDVQSVGDLAEYTVAVSFGRAILEVQGRVVGHVDEELASGAVDGIGQPHHGDGSSPVLHAVVGLVEDGRAAGLLHDDSCHNRRPRNLGLCKPGE